MLEGDNSREVPLHDNRDNLGCGVLIHYKLPNKEDWYANYCNACFNRLNIVKHPEPEAK